MAGRPPTKTAPPFGKKLAAIRKSKGLSQEDLASRLGSTRANVAYYERKATNPTIDLIQRCAEILDVPLIELIGDTATNSKKPGPKSRLEQQFEHISKLPRARQQFVSKVIDDLLATSKRS